MTEEGKRLYSLGVRSNEHGGYCQSIVEGKHFSLLGVMNARAYCEGQWNNQSKSIDTNCLISQLEIVTIIYSN